MMKAIKAYKASTVPSLCAEGETYDLKWQTI